MKTARAMAGLLMLALLLALAPAALAQDLSLGLSPEDSTALSEAAAATAAADSGQFTFDVSMDFSMEGEPGSFTLNGTGTWDHTVEGDLMLALTLAGQATAEGRTTPLNAEIRLVNETLYLNSPLLGMPQWISLSASDMNSFSAMLPVDPTALQEEAGNLGATGTGDVAALMASIGVDAAQFVRMSRSGDTFTTTVDIIGLLSSPEFQAFLMEQSSSAGDLADMGDLEEMQQQMAQLPQAMQGTTLTVNQTIGGGMLTGLSAQMQLNMDPVAAGMEGDPASITMNLNVALSNFNQEFAVSVPADSVTLEQMMSQMFEGMGADS